MQDDLTRDKLMNPCPNCGTDNMIGVMVCRSCGALLGDVVPGATYKLDHIEAEADRPLADAVERSSHFANDAVLTIKLREVDQPMVYPVDEERLVVGRRDPNTDYTPEIDFYRYAGYLLGVSRRHAYIYRDGEQLMLEDLGSHNGTFVNGNQLAPKQPHLLRDGDTIRLGDLQFTVHF